MKLESAVTFDTIKKQNIFDVIDVESGDMVADLALCGDEKTQEANANHICLRWNNFDELVEWLEFFNMAFKKEIPKKAGPNSLNQIEALLKKCKGDL